MKSPKSTQRTREIVKARNVAGTVVVSLPAAVREPLTIEAGDRLCVEVSGPKIIITKE